MKKILALIGAIVLLAFAFASRSQAGIVPPVDYWVASADGADWSYVDGSLRYGLPELRTWMGSDLLFIPNRADPKKQKELYLELDYASTIPVSFKMPEVFSDPRTIVAFVAEATTANSIALHWTITPQPCYEIIGLWPGWNDGLVKMEVATICVPEPATLFAGIAALGLIALGWNRRNG